MSIYDDFRGIPTGNICDQTEGMHASPEGIMPLDVGMSFCGRALTVRCDPGDNLPIHKALTVARPGDVLVVSCGDRNTGIFGEMLTLSCMSKGIKAFVTDGGVRDRKEIIELGFPVFSASVSPNGSGKIDCGKINVPVKLCGVTVRPGDVVVGDGDGVCFIPLEQAEEVLRKAKAKKEKESELRKRIMKGVTVAEAMGFADKLK